MAKKIETEAVVTDTPYINEDAPKQPWLKTKRGKLVAAIAGGALILGGTFAAGVKVGQHLGGEGTWLSFGDRDHNFGGQNGFGGQSGQFQGPGQFGHPDDGGQFNPNQQGGTNGQPGTTGSTNGSTGTNP